MTAVHVVVPQGIDDPARPSGGNAYDRRICRGLAATGWSVHEHPVPGGWPLPDAAAYTALAGVVATIPDDALVLLDGLIASTAPQVLVPQARRLRLVVLVHMPLGGLPADGLPADGLPAVARAREQAVLSAAGAVITTSAWTRRQLLEWYALPPDHVHVATPGVDSAHLDAVPLDTAHLDTAQLAPGTATGGELLCVAAVTPHKGHDVLIAALATLPPTRCVCVGSLDRDPDFVDRLRRRAKQDGIGDRVHFTGPLTANDLDKAYAAADVLVLASRAETYGMVVTEALARRLPVIATAVGGLPEALGQGADGTPPGLLVPPDDPAALAAALRRWLSDANLRQRLRRAADERRETLSDWSATTARIADVLAVVRAGTAGVSS